MPEPRKRAPSSSRMATLASTLDTGGSGPCGEPRRHAGVARAGAGDRGPRRGGLGGGPAALRAARPVAAARAPGAAARSAGAVPGTRHPGRLRHGHRRSRNEPGRRRRDRRHRLRLGRALHGERLRFRHRRRRAAGDGPGQAAARAGTGAREPAAVRAAGRERRRQPDEVPGRGLHPRRQHLPQPGAPVGGGPAGGDGDARLVDRGRRLPDRTLRLHRDGARPFARLPRRAAAADGRHRRGRDRRRTRRRADARQRLGPGRLPGRGRPRRAADRPRHRRQARLAAPGRAAAQPSCRRACRPKTCSA